ncbi:hypothetical protein ACFY64_31740 [Streptomyces collinus]|uniref:hypothetical protein n=1 Tax=Streptomyces collinus TaxID=42684 RepID=UPI00368C6AE2
MGAILEATPTMEPWFNVEVRRESAYVTATTYIRAYYRQRSGEGDITAHEKDAAWRPVGEHEVVAPGTPKALASALRQITEHRAYREWLATGSHAGDAGAELREGKLHVTAPTSHWYEEIEGAAEKSHIEFGYEDVGPILADLERLTA